MFNAVQFNTTIYPQKGNTATVTSSRVTTLYVKTKSIKKNLCLKKCGIGNKYIQI